MTAPVLSVPTANGRFYQHPARNVAVPSITNVIGMKDKPGLKHWAAKMAAEYAADNLGKLQALDRNEAYALIKGAPFARRDDSPSAIGDIVHNAIDDFVKEGGEPDTTGWPSSATQMWRQFGLFNARYQPRYLDSEFTVWSNSHNYAGTADLAFAIGNTLILADTKTGNKVYPETGMQLAALARADFILTPEGEEKPLYNFERYAVLHVRPRSYALIPVEKMDEAWQAFLALRTVFHWHVTHADSTLGYAPRVGARAA